MPGSVLQIPFSKGLMSKIPATILEPGQGLLRAENGVMNRHGAFEARPGTVAQSKALVGGGTIAAALRMVSMDAEQLLSDGHSLLAFSSAANAWTNVGPVPEPLVTRTPLVQAGIDANSFDCAYTNGMLAVTYNVVNGAGQLTFVAVFDATTMSLISPPQFVGTQLYPSIIAAGRYFVWMIPSANLVYRVFDTLGALTWTAQTTLAADYVSTSGDARYDAVDISTIAHPSRFAIVYPTARVTDTLSIRTFDVIASVATLVATKNSLTSGTTVVESMSIGGNGNDTIWVAFSSGPSPFNVDVFGLDPVTLGVSATRGTWLNLAIVDTLAIAATGTGLATIVAGNAGGFTDPDASIVRGGNVSGFATPTATWAWSKLYWNSHPFFVDGHVYAFARLHNGNPTIQRMQYCIDITSATPFARAVATPAPLLAGDVQVIPGAAGPLVPHVAVLPGSRIAWPMSVARTVPTRSLDLVTLDFRSSARFRATPTTNTLVLSGSNPYAYDGNGIHEIGFAMAPEFVSSPSAPITTSGAGAVNGTVQYVLVFEWFDAKGNRDQSAPSLPQTFVASSNTLVLHFQSLQVSNKMQDSVASNPVRIVVYRTIDSGTTFFRLGTRNNQQSKTITFTDNVSDASLQTANSGQSLDLLYSPPNTPGAPVARFVPPPFLDCVTHAQRLFGLAEDGVSIWPSGQFVEGERPWFSPLFQTPIAGLGQFHSLASCDGRLYVLGTKGIAVVDGQGPTDNGSGGDFQINAIPTDVGCIEPNSVVVTPKGIMFESAFGIHLLPRGGGELVCVSDPVQEELTAFPTITSAKLRSNAGRVYFTCLPASGTGAGIALVYDYIEDVWSKFTWADPDGGAGALAGAVSADVIGGSDYVFATATGRVYREARPTDPFPFLDAGSVFVGVVIEIPNVKVAGLQGFQRAWTMSVIAETYTAHDLRISIAFDYATTYDQVTMWSAATLATLDREQLREVLVQQDCQAVRALFEVLPPSSGVVGSGRAAAFLGVAFEISTRGGLGRRPTNSTR